MNISYGDGEIQCGTYYINELVPQYKTNKQQFFIVKPFCNKKNIIMVVIKITV